MTAQAEIRPIASAEEIAHAGAMVLEFFDYLRTRIPEMLENIEAYIAHQDIDRELREFSQIFMPPAGACLLAHGEESPLGMVMLKSAGEDTSEMNRMYVRPEARGQALGRRLCLAIIETARARGDRLLLLDTLAPLAEAIALYRDVGFEEYRPEGGFDADNPSVLHFRLPLTD